MKRAVLTTLALCSLASAGCRGQTSEDSPVTLLRNMHFQQRYMPQSHSAFFKDGRTMRTPVRGTVSREEFFVDGQIREEYLVNDRITLGLEDNGGGYVATIPQEVVNRAGGEATGMRALVERGQQRFGIYCTPCHGAVGDGQGIIVTRAQGAGYQFPPPASFHEERVRHMPDGQLYATITNGIRNMPSYAAQIPVQDRWAVVAYVRALQLSQANSTGATQ